MRRSKNKIKDNFQDKIFNIVSTLLLAFLGLIVFYPLYFILIASFSDPMAVNNGEVLFLPVRISFEGYKSIFQDSRIWTGYLNTFIYTILGTIFGVIITILAAYPLSRKELKGRNVIMILFIITMYFGGGLVPTFLQINKYGLYNTSWIMVILGSVSAWNVIVARTFFQNNIPGELFEAASIDGCGEGRFFITMVLPLSKAIIAVIALYIGVMHWNQYFNAMIYLSDADLQPLQIILRNILISNQMVDVTSVDAANLAERTLLAEYIKYGVVVVSSLPILAVYPFLQKYFVKGVTIGALKG
ncbi:MAG: carbohydrate ABC transporter permease [Clostridium sp.]